MREIAQVQMLHPSEGELNFAHSDKSFACERQHMLIEPCTSKGEKQHIAEEHGGDHDLPALNRLPFLTRLFPPGRCSGCCPFCMLPKLHTLPYSPTDEHLYHVVA